MGLLNHREPMMPIANNKEKRHSNVELFRIVIMLLIIAHHYVGNSGLLESGGPIDSAPFAFNSLFLLIFGAWGKMGINCFVIITGYFMCTSTISIRKIVKLVLEVIFYNVIIYTVFVITGYEQLSVNGVLNTVFIVRNLSNGFTSCFVVFYLFIPFINILVRNLNEKQHILLLMLCGFMYIVLGTIPSFYVNTNYVSWFVVLYFFASYLRLYPKPIFNNAKLWGTISLLLILISVATVVFGTLIGTKIDRFVSYYFVEDSNTFLAFATGLSLFIFFNNINMPYNKFVNTIASTTFGVLLIHANSDIMRKWLWIDLLHNKEAYESKFLPLHAIGSVIAVFIICSSVDYLRIKILETNLFKFLDHKFGNCNLWRL